MLKKILAFIIVFSHFMTFNVSDEYVFENNGFSTWVTQVFELSCRMTDYNPVCGEWIVNNISNLVNESITEIDKIMNIVLKLRNELPAKSPDRILKIKSINQNIECVRDIIADARNTLNKCKEFCTIVGNAYDKKCGYIVMSDNSDFGNKSVTKRDINPLNNLYKSCFETSNNSFIIESIWDEKSRLKCLVDSSLYVFKKHMMDCNALYFYLFTTDKIIEKDCNIEVLSEDIANLNSVVDIYENFFNVIQQEMVKNNFPTNKDTSTVVESENVVISDASYDQSKYDNKKNDCSLIKEDVFFSDPCYVDYYEDESLSNSYPSSPIEDVKVLLRKQSKGKNRVNPLMRKSSDRKHYGYYDKYSGNETPDERIRSEVVPNRFTEKKRSCDITYDDLQNYDPEDMFNPFGDIYSNFIQG